MQTDINKALLIICAKLFCNSITLVNIALYFNSFAQVTRKIAARPTDCMTNFQTPTPKHRSRRPGGKDKYKTPTTDLITVSPRSRSAGTYRTESSNRALTFENDYSDSNDDNDQDGDKMTDTTERGKLLSTYVQGLRITTHPTRVDTVNFKKHVANALTKCQSETNAAGHSYIIESEDQYQLRLKNRSAALPIDPVQPMMPTGASTTAWKQFGYKRSVYNTHREYSLQTKELITKYFPRNFTGLYNTKGNLPIELTAKQMIDHL